MPTKFDSYLMVFERLFAMSLLCILAIETVHPIPHAVIIADLIITLSLGATLIARMFFMVKRRFR